MKIKKRVLALTFALIGMFAFLAPKAANAVEPGTYPGTYIICGNYCFCGDAYDYIMWDDMFC